MKILLVSPKDPDRPGSLKLLLGGENTFTRTLLANPPPGVEYLHHEEALKEGRIDYSFWQRPLSVLGKTGILPPDAGIYTFRVKDKFDLIHSHAYCLKVENYSGPVILSDSSSNFLFLRDYLGWSKARIKIVYKIRGPVAKSLNIYDQNLNLYKATKLIVWSNFAKNVHQNLGADPQKIVVIPPGIEKLPGKKNKTRNFTILFIGVWFARKGGLLLLEAFNILKAKYPQIRLNLVGELPKGLKLPKDTWHQNFISREKLIREIFPQADVLVLVPPVVEGYGLVVLEAASLGIPAIVSRVYALPEIVLDQETGFVITPESLRELVMKLEILIKNPQLCQRMGEAARRRFLDKFWIEKTNEELLKVYHECCEKESF